MRRVGALGAACTLLLALAARGEAAVEVQARLSRNAITVGEASSLEVRVRGAGGRVEEPEFSLPPGLEVLSRGRAQNFTWVNGKSSVEVVFRYEIAAAAAGRYPVGPIAVRAGREVFRSGVLTLEAAAAPTRIGAGGTGPASLVVDVVPPEPWQGEPCQLRVRLVQRAPLAEDPEYTPPPAPGFWSERPSPPESYYADERGEPVLVTETRTRIYPLAPGVATVGEAGATLALADGERDPLAGLGGGTARRRVTVRSRPVQVRVRPLPAGAPPGFTGGVGGLSVRWSADRARTPVDVPFTLRLDVRGVGNLPLMRPPSLAGEAVEVFASTIEDSLAPPGSEAAGRKRFQWTVLARQPGRLTLEAPAFAWFDPQAGVYRRADPSPIRVDVAPAMFAGEAEGAGFPAAIARHPIDPRARPAAPWAWTLAGLLLGAAVVLWRRSRALGAAAAARAQPLAWLRVIGRASGPDFWRAADEASTWLAQRGRPVEDLRRQVAAARFSGGGGDPAAVRRALEQRIAAALPPSPPMGALRAVAVALVVVAAAVCVVFGPRPGDARARAAVRAADQAARTGDVVRARRGWEALWQADVRHPALAARLAWVSSQAGAVGEAATWVVRGEQAGGRDPALAWVARRVRDGGGLVGHSRTRWPLRPLEWALAALVCGGAAGLCWPRRGLAATCVALALLAGALDGLQAAAAARAERAVVREAATLEGAELELQAGQVVRLLERRGDRVRVGAGGGVEGWLPVRAVDVVTGAS